MVVALVAVVAAAMGTVSTLALRRARWSTQLDEKLTAAPPARGGLSRGRGHAVGDPRRGLRGPAPAPATVRPGQDAGTVNVEQPAGVDPADLTVFQARLHRRRRHA